MIRLALIPLALLAATPAHADAFTNREVAFQVLNAADTIETCHVLATGKGYEANPLIGKHPSCGRLVGIKAVSGAVHWFVADRINRIDPEFAKWFQIITNAIQGAVVAANLRVVF